MTNAHVQKVGPVASKGATPHVLERTVPTHMSPYLNRGSTELSGHKFVKNYNNIYRGLKHDCTTA